MAADVPEYLLSGLVHVTAAALCQGSYCLEAMQQIMPVRGMPVAPHKHSRQRACGQSPDHGCCDTNKAPTEKDPKGLLTVACAPVVVAVVCFIVTSL